MFWTHKVTADWVRRYMKIVELDRKTWHDVISSDLSEDDLNVRNKWRRKVKGLAS